MSESGSTSATDELRKRWHDSKPTKTELEKAQYGIDEYRPSYPDSTGWPAMRKLKAIFILCTGYIAFWVYYSLRVRDGLVPQIPIIDGLAFLDVIGMSSLALGMLWKLNEGCFSDFRIILEPFLVIYHGRLFRSMLRIRRIKQIYPLAPEVEITADDLAGDLAAPKTDTKIIWSTKKPTRFIADESTAKDVGGGITRTTLRQVEDSAPKTDPPVKKKTKVSKNDSLRPSSIAEMKELVSDILQEEPVEFKDNVDMGVELEKRFVELVRSVNLDAFVNLAETPKFPALFITDYPVESPTGEAKGIQFGFHDFYQKTYVWDKKNSSSSSWAIGVHLDDFRFHVWNKGKKKYDLKFAPIFYVAFSDGNLDDLLMQLWPKDREERQKRRAIIDARELATHAKSAYTATLAEELIIRDKMHTGIIDAKDKEINQLQRQSTKGSKKVIARGLRYAVLAGEALDDSNLDRLRAIFSKGAIKYILYLIIAIFVFVGFLLVLQILTGIQFFNIPPPGNGGGTPDDGADIYDPSSILFSLIRWLL